MKCIVKNHRFMAGILALAFCMSGCGQEIVPEQPYGVYAAAEAMGIPAADSLEPDTAANKTGSPAFFGASLCVGGNTDLTAEGVTDSLSEAAGLFDVDNREILYARNIHARLHPASTTKILTAYVAIKYGDLSATTRVSEAALQLEQGSSVCGLSVGDVISLEQLLYGLLLCSGNDAAIAIAEMISGSQEAFAELMNQEALALGATNSHFVNSHGLTHEEHYTTLYDLYLISQAAMEFALFREIIEAPSYHAAFQNQAGKQVTKEWDTSNQYLKGDKKAPEGVTVLGGKTGTTSAAGNCLVLFSQDSGGGLFISIVLKADGRDNLYVHMNELLKKIE